MTQPDHDTSAEIGERISAFHDEFGGAEFIEDSLIAATHRLADIAAALFGHPAAEKALAELVAACLGGNARQDWRSALEADASGLYSEMPGGTLLHDLTAYADYGIVLADCRTLAEREALLEKDVQRGWELLELVTPGSLDAPSGPLWRVVRAAMARWKLDRGMSVDALELSLLSGLALQSVRNRLAGKSREIKGSQKSIEAADALVWLTEKTAFLPSLWRDQDDSAAVALSETYYTDPLFVPVATDRSIFHPALIQNGVYTVGEAGAEQQHRAFRDALAALQAMVSPTWLRPLPNGRWTRVRAADWQRYSWDDLKFEGEQQLRRQTRG
jgi:hypothetical protein